MAFTYPTALRESAHKRMLAGERVDDLADELEVSATTLFRWKKKALIDAGRKPGLKSYEPDELARVRATGQKTDQRCRGKARTGHGGQRRVVEQLLECFPDAANMLVGAAGRQPRLHLLPEGARRQTWSNIPRGR